MLQFLIFCRMASYVGGADQPPVNQLVQWTVPVLAPDQALSLDLTVTAQHSIINSNYWVTTDEGASAKGLGLVITVVDHTPLPVNGDGVEIVNDRAEISWRVNGQLNQSTSNSVFNPAFPLFLPLVKQ